VALALMGVMVLDQVASWPAVREKVGILYHNRLHGKAGLELLRRLDWVVKHWSRNDANLQALKRTPSEQITQQLAFTPFVFEEVGSFIDQSNDELYLFSSDYPHIEGGRNPIGRFEAALGERPPAVRDKFYADNFRRIFAAA